MPLIQLAASANRSPRQTLVLFHSVDGDARVYQELADALARVCDIAIVGVSSPLLDAEPAMSAPSLGELAAHYAAELDAIQSSQLFLAGWSFGAIVAWEVAPLVGPRASEAGAVIAIDARVPVPAMRARTLDAATAARIYVQRELRMRGRTETVPDDIAGETIDAALAADVCAMLERMDVGDSALSVADMVRQLRAFQAHGRAMFQHQCEPREQTAFLLESRDVLPAHPKPKTLGWEALTTRLAVLAIPGNHFTVLAPAHIPDLADALRRCLVGAR